MKFPHSRLATLMYTGLQGVEIGGSAHNPFGLNTVNVDFTDSMETVFKKEELRLCGEQLKVDVVASGDRLPFPEEHFDFLISSHVLEHFWDTIGTLFEWLRVVKHAEGPKLSSIGTVFVIVPDPCKTGERLPITTLSELGRRLDQEPREVDHGHQTVFSLDLIYEIADYMDNICLPHGVRLIHAGPDDKVGNGFCFVLQKVSWK